MDLSLDIEKVLNARLVELNSLSKEIKQKSNKLILQRLPRYMRRRAASHNPKRVPSKFIKYPLIAVGNSVLKEKRRKQRKKHVNKLKKRLSILKRNKKPSRTILHIWFRKRFKLIKELDYLIPLKNNTKNFRNLHKVSINQCSFYSRPVNRTLEIKFENEQLLINALNLFRSKFFKFHQNLSTSQLQSSTREFDLFFSNDHQCIGHVNFLKANEDTILFTIPADIYSSINQLLVKSLTDANLNHTVYEYRFERFRLIGPKSFKYLENLLNCDLNKTTTINEQSKKISDINLNFQNCCFQIIDDSRFFGPQTNMIILLKDKSRSILDVLVPRKLTKKLWYNLVKNKSHLVGGKIDCEYYALENNFICYPSIGCLDLRIHKESNKVKLLSAILKFHQNQNKVVIVRSNEFLSLCERPFKNEDKIKEFLKNDRSQSFLNVKLQTIKKGTIEENDLIYLPTEQDLIKLNDLLNMSREERYIENLEAKLPTEQIKLSKFRVSDYSDEKELDSMLKLSSRKVVGVVELGKFCLKSGKYEAFGALYSSSLPDLINLNRDRQTLNVLIRSENSNKFRYCSMIVKNFSIF